MKTLMTFVNEKRTIAETDSSALDFDIDPIEETRLKAKAQAELDLLDKTIEEDEKAHNAISTD